MGRYSIEGWNGFIVVLGGDELGRTRTGRRIEMWL